MTQPADDSGHAGLPEDMRLTDREADIASRWWKGEATEDELREVLSAHIDRLIASGRISARVEGMTGQGIESDVDCHQLCALGGGDHPGTRGYRCIDMDGNTLPFPGEPYPYAHDYPTVSTPSEGAS